MSELDYSATGLPVSGDLIRCHQAILDHIAAPGTWWTGAERVAIAAESREALTCDLCARRKDALSPNAVSGEHDATGRLPLNVVDVIHRVRTDFARLSKSWFDEAIASGLAVPQYVELIGVVTLLAGTDYFCRAVGAPPFPLPEPKPGEPARRTPDHAKPGTAWVPMLAPEDADGPEADLYGDLEVVPNILRALSLVPDQVRMLRRSSDAHYVAMGDLMNPAVGRDLDRLQIELVAARVSALNECFY